MEKKVNSDLQQDYLEQSKLVKDLQTATNTLVHDSGSTDISKIKAVQEEYKTAVKELNDINKKLQLIQQQTEKDIKDTSNSINDYKETLHNNHMLFERYKKNIKDKMQLVATRDRMLQLSQERNMYKRKIIYVLFSIIISLLIFSISAYTIFRKKS